MFCDPTVSRPIPATGNLKSRFGDVTGQHFIVFLARGNGFLISRMFSTGRRNDAPTGIRWRIMRKLLVWLICFSPLPRYGAQQETLSAWVLASLEKHFHHV